MWRWQRREKKQEAKKARMPKHGKGMMQFYANAILKRLKGQKKKSSCPGSLTSRNPATKLGTH